MTLNCPPFMDWLFPWCGPVCRSVPPPWKLWPSWAYLTVSGPYCWSYDGMTPPDSAVHGALAAWVMAGHALLCFGRGDDAYATVPSWWNGNVGGVGPWADLFECLEMASDPAPGDASGGSGARAGRTGGPDSLWPDAQVGPQGRAWGAAHSRRGTGIGRPALPVNDPICYCGAATT